MKQKKSLGETLVEEGIITAQQLAQARVEEKRSGERLRKVIVKMGLIDEEDLVTLVSEKLHVPRIELASYLVDPKVVELVPESLARKYEVMPVFKIGNRLTCAMADPWNVFALDELRVKTHFVIEPAVATQGEIKKALDEHYGAKGSLQEVIQSLDAEKLEVPEGKEVDLKKLEGIVKEPVVVKLVNLLIMQAIREGASDIHIEPEESRLKTRFRVDGILREVTSSPKHLQSAIVSRIKILADLDIAERRIPQDGRFHLRMEGKEIDVRVSCLPTLYGENVVLRLLDVSSALLSLSQLGFSKELLEKYEKLIRQPYGIILVTGPTGSGKTTTLYASLDKINTVDKNIITIEDPIEYRLEGIRQTQINPKVNLTFANGLRSILRQDPNVIMVGEIRDCETAEIAIQAALTGHLVLSTLHTNDAAGAITRLTDMGVEPFLVASSIIGVLAQRLVRTLCKECKESCPLSAFGGQLGDLGLEAQDKELRVFRKKGCPKCLETGYKGRIGIFELMQLDEKMRGLILAKASRGEIKKQAQSAGLIPLREMGIQKILEGLTTIEEVLRVTREE